MEIRAADPYGRGGGIRLAMLGGYRDPGDDRAGGVLAIVGDTQRTEYLELLFGRESNDAAREALFEHLAREKPDLLAMVGDLVCFGASRREWEYLDRLLAAVHEGGAAILPALGNHDHYGPNRRALRFAGERFPQLRSGGWYTRRWGALRLVWLNSNRWDLGARLWAEQLRWFEQTLAVAELDPEVRGVIVLLHHPPYCNSQAPRESSRVRDDLVPPYRSSYKGMLLVTGHAHLYEHLLVDDRHYIVTGGGGGPRDMVQPHDRCRRFPVYHNPSRPPFHFLTVTAAAAGIQVTVKGIDGPAGELRIIDQFALTWPGSS